MTINILEIIALICLLVFSVMMIKFAIYTKNSIKNF